MRIAILGTRGVPAKYGGFETFAEELGARLAAKGHRVTVYGRSHVVPPIREYRGMIIRRFPTVQHKYFDTVVHTAISVLAALPQRDDIVLMCNNANAPFAAFSRLSGARVALNVDGLEWNRAKWGRLGRAYYRFCARLAPKLPVVLVSDAVVIAEYYKRAHNAPTVFIPYGSDGRRLPPGKTLQELCLEPQKYLLYVSRLEPENSALEVVEAYRRAGGLAGLGVPLVLVGDAPYASDYRRQVMDLASVTPGASAVGYQFGDAYVELQSNCMVYIQATQVGGTHPALVEAMGRGVPIVANDVPEHREVLGDCGAYFRLDDGESLAAVLRTLVASDADRASMADRARERGLQKYSWDAVAGQYESLFQEMLKRKADRA